MSLSDKNPDDFINELSSRLKDVDTYTKQQEDNKEVVLIIGNTGAGKSTFANYIIGKSMREEKVKGSLEKGVVCDDPVMEIGHGFISKTTFPHTHYDHHSSLTFCDCPGFLDTRDALFDISNVYAMTKVSRCAKSIRAIVVVLSYHSLLTDRARAIADTCRMLETLFGRSNYSRQLHSVVVLISKAPPSMDIRDIRSFLLEGSEASSAEIRHVFSRAQLCDPLEREPGSPRRVELLDTLRSCSPLEPHEFTFCLAPESLEQLESAVRACRCSLVGDKPLNIDALLNETFRSSLCRLRNLLNTLELLGSPQVLEMRQAVEESIDRSIRQLIRSNSWNPDDQLLANIEKLKQRYSFLEEAVKFIEDNALNQLRQQAADRAREEALAKERERIEREAAEAEKRHQAALREREEQERREAQIRRQREEAERERQLRQQQLEAAQRERREAEERARRRYHPGHIVHMPVMTVFGPMFASVYTCCMRDSDSPGCASGGGHQSIRVSYRTL